MAAKPGDEYRKVAISEEIELEGEVLPQMCAIRESTMTVIAVFPRGTSYKEVKEAIGLFPGVTVGVVKVQTNYIILEEAKFWPPPSEGK